MIRIKVLIFSLLFAILGSPIAAIASDITNALYFGTIIVSNNSTATTNVATTGNISTSNLITGQYLNATANNCVVRNSSGADVRFMPGYTNANLWCFWVPSIGVDSYLTYILYTANSTGGEIRYFPASGGMTIVDDASLELGTLDFSLNMTDTFVNTDAGINRNLINKVRAFAVSDDITADEIINVGVFGLLSPCLDFIRANNDWVRIPDDNAFSFTDGAGNDEPFTIIVWVNFDDATSSSIVTKRAAGQAEWAFETLAGDTMHVELSDLAGANTITATTLAVTGDEGSWHHYAVTYDGSELNTGLELYRDGVNNLNARGGAGAYVGMANGTENPNIGSVNNGGVNYMDGQMAEVKIYNAELTLAEILADFNGVHRTPDLVAWWPIDEGTGLPQDISGNGHNANQNLADWINEFSDRLTTVASAVSVESDEYDISINRDDEPAMPLWANDVVVGVNMGSGILPIKLLQEQTLTAPAASITFSGITGNVSLWDSLAGVTSRHLVVMVNAANSGAIGNALLHTRFNGDSGNNYNYQRLWGNAGVTGASRTASGSWIWTFTFPGTTFANAFGGGTLLIPHAFNTTNHKATLSIGGAVEDFVATATGRWANTDAIDSITLTSFANDFIIGSTFLLGVIDERYLVEEAINPAADFVVDFTTIPQTGDDLVVIGYSQSDLGAVEDEIIHEINNDAHAPAYPTQKLTGRAGVPAAAQQNDEIGMTSGDNAAANEFGALIATYSQYAEITNQAHYTSLSGYHESTGPTSEVRAMSGRWPNVAAITQIELYPNAGANFKAGSLFSLYRVPRYVIDRQELTANSPTITFANIPQNYQALQLNVYARGNVAALTDTVSIEINTDVVDANFDNQELEGTGAGPPTATRISGLAGSRVIMLIPAINEGANEFGGGIVTFNQYTNTVGHKHFLTLSGTQENQVILRSSRWEDTSAITQIVLDLPGAQAFLPGSIFELVGLMPTQTFNIDIDGEIKGVADGNADVPDTTTDWVIGGDATPYIGRYEHEVADVLQSDIPWRYGSTFYDRSYYGVEFDGVDDYIDIDTIAADFNAGEGTIIAWFNMESFVAFSRIFSHLNGAADRVYLGIALSGADQRLWYRFGDLADTYGNTDLLVSTWYCAALTWWDNGTDSQLYLNGVVDVATQTHAGIVKGTQFALGSNQIGTGNYFDGVEDEVLIYNRALTPAEILYAYNSGLGIYTPFDTTGLVSWWHLENGTGVVATDSSGNGNDGTLTNGPLWVNGHVPLPPTETGTNPATPTFRSASSNLNVTANMTTFQPISQATAPAYALGPVNPFIEGTANIVGAFTTTPPAGTFPLAGVIAAIANATATPPQLPLLIIAIFVILAASLTTSYTLRKFGSGTLIVKSLVIIGLMGIFIALGDFGIDFWMLFIFAILAVALSMMSRQITWR